jgi:glycosyltransferase involved in cell wall biosynthesis
MLPEMNDLSASTTQGMNGRTRKKLLIFVVAYDAGKTIRSVLSRIPVKQLPPETEVLVIDDSSGDKTFDLALKSRDVLGGLKLTVLFNPVNQGYGGNQKIGYQYAIQNGFDVVALLHGDGQYAPEQLPALVTPVLTGEADACFGSRMMEHGQALKDGMPLYKFIGNKILTSIENRMLGAKLSEFHSGYRVYSVNALKQLPFRYNTNDFHFDTEIIIQFLMRGFCIKELPIPTYYGDEICHVNGIAYAWNVVVAALASRIHLAGILYQKRYDVAGETFLYDLKLGYPSSHTMAISRVKPGSTVLDVACGTGLVARELTGKGCVVTGIDKVCPDNGSVARSILHDLDSPALPGDLSNYDYILALDCLEHLDSPERLLEQLRIKCFSERSTLILTAPNIGFFFPRFGLMFGQFNYGRQGILDLTHKRLFTFPSFRRLLEQEGYEIVRTRGIPAPYPKAMGDNWLSRFFLMVNRFLILISRGIFSYQIYIEAKFRPPLESLLARTISTSAEMERKNEQFMGIY